MGANLIKGATLTIGNHFQKLIFFFRSPNDLFGECSFTNDFLKANVPLKKLLRKNKRR